MSENVLCLTPTNKIISTILYYTVLTPFLWPDLNAKEFYSRNNMRKEQLNINVSLPLVVLAELQYLRLLQCNCPALQKIMDELYKPPEGSRSFNSPYYKPVAYLNWILFAFTLCMISSCDRSLLCPRFRSRTRSLLHFRFWYTISVATEIQKN